MPDRAQPSRRDPREIERAIFTFEFTRAVQCYASELGEVAAEWDAIADNHRTAADELELPRPPKDQTRARLLAYLTTARDAIEAVLVGHGSARRGRLVAELPHPLGALVADLHLETEPCEAVEAETAAEAPAAYRRCAAKFIAGADTLHRWLNARALGAKLREAGRGDGGAHVNIARRDLVAWAKAHGLGYMAIAGELAMRMVALEPAGTQPYRWSERRTQRNARPVGVACPVLTHRVAWDESDPARPRPILLPLPPEHARIEADHAGRTLPDVERLRAAWIARLKRAFAENRNRG